MCSKASPTGAETELVKEQSWALAQILLISVELLKEDSGLSGKARVHVGRAKPQTYSVFEQSHVLK